MLRFMRRFARRVWCKVTLADWAERQKDQPMSCHCWTVEEVWLPYPPYRGGRIVKPLRHEAWCPAGKTPREFEATMQAGQGVEGG